uniref:Uncharacterized protein n=1 Tax=Strigamia maritima TaxID=126957 RepID=T1IWY8_STRMM
MTNPSNFNFEKIEKYEDKRGGTEKEVIQGNKIEAGGDVMTGDGFASTKIYGGATTPANGQNTLKDLKKLIKVDECIDNFDRAIFQVKTEDGELVEICNSYVLSSGEIVYVTYKTE